MAKAPRTSKSSKVSKATKNKIIKQKSKSDKKKAKVNLDTKSVVCTTNLICNASQGVTVNNYVYAGIPFAFNNPNSLGYNQLYNFYCSQYQRVRINKMVVKVVPKANVLDQGNAQLDSNFAVNGDGLVHTCIDRDSIAPASIATIQKYPSYKPFSVMKTFSRAMKVLWPKGTWLSTKNALDSPTSLALLQQLGATGTVTLYAENLLEDNWEILNEPWANIEIQWHCVFQGYDAPAMKVSQDPSGNNIYTLYPQPAIPVVAQSTLSAVTGQLNGDYVIDLSGNTVIRDELTPP